MEFKNNENFHLVIKFIRLLAYYSFTFLLSPLLLVVCLIFAVYRKIVDIILRIKLGDKYGGLLATEDAIFVNEDVNATCNITPIFIFKCDEEKDVYSYVRKKLIEKVFNHPERDPKLTSTQHFFMGYPYWLKDQLTIDDCLKTIPVPESGYNEEYLMDFVAKVGQSKFPKNGSQLWEVYFGKQPIEYNNNEKCYRYAMSTKFHHAMVDGTSLIAFWVSILGNTENYCGNLFWKTNNKKLTFLEKVQVFVNKTMSFLYMVYFFLFIAVGNLMYNAYFRKNDENNLHGKQLTGEKSVYWLTEDQRELVPMIKRIKNRVPNAKFSDVVFTSITASITDYFQRNNYSVPEYTSHMIPVLLYFPKIDHDKPINLLNKSSLAAVELPKNGQSIVETLEKVKSRSAITSYHDVLAIYMFLTNIAGLFPTKLMQLITLANCYTCMITNVPGTALCNVFDGCIVDKPIAVAPNMRKAGITFTLVTYDEKFYLSITADKAYIKTREEVQKLQQDFVHNIRLLDIETQKLCKDKDV